MTQTVTEVATRALGSLKHHSREFSAADKLAAVNALADLLIDAEAEAAAAAKQAESGSSTTMTGGEVGLDGKPIVGGGHPSGVDY